MKVHSERLAGIVGKREDIMKAALELFAERGFHGTAVPLIAERAGVGAGTIYRHFRDKEHLVNELYRHWKQALHGAMTEGLDLDQPLRSLFHHSWRRWVDFCLENPLVFSFLTEHHHAPYLDRETKDLAENIHCRAMELFVKGREALVFEDAPPAMLMAVVSGVTSAVIREASQGYFELDEERLALTEELIWRAIRR